MKRLIPLLMILAACEQPVAPCAVPDGGTVTRMVRPELATYTDAKAACEANGLRLTTAHGYDDREALVAACPPQDGPCWVDAWGSRSAAEGGGVGPAVVRDGLLVVVPSTELAIYLAHPICDTPVP